MNIRIIFYVLIVICFYIIGCVTNEVFIDPEGYIDKDIFNSVVNRLYKEIDDLEKEIRFVKEELKEKLKEELKEELIILKSRIGDLEKLVNSITENFNNNLSQKGPLKKEDIVTIKKETNVIKKAIKKIKRNLKEKDSDFKDVNSWWKGLPPTWRELFTKIYQGYPNNDTFIKNDLIRDEKEKLFHRRRFEFIGDKLTKNKKLTNLRGLRNIPNLNFIDVTFNNLESDDLNAIIKLSSLKELRIGQNTLTNLNPLNDSNLPNLESLYLNNNNITSILPLKSLKSLKVLDCKNNKIKSLNGIESLIGLNYLYCANNPITNIDALVTLIRNPLSKITYVQIPRNKSFSRILNQLDKVKNNKVKIRYLPFNED